MNYGDICPLPRLVCRCHAFAFFSSTVLISYKYAGFAFGGGGWGAGQAPNRGAEGWVREVDVPIPTLCFFPRKVRYFSVIMVRHIFVYSLVLNL